MSAIVTWCCWSLNEYSYFIWIVKVDFKKRVLKFQLPSNVTSKRIRPNEKGIWFIKGYEWNGKAYFNLSSFKKDKIIIVDGL